MSDRERFDKFTERARSSLQAALNEARALDSRAITTAHLFTGLVDGRFSVAGRVLRSNNTRLERARRALRRLESREQHLDHADVGLTREAKRAIEHSVDLARRLGHHYIGAEHLLLGLLDEDADARALVRSLHVDPEYLQAYALATIRGEPTPAIARPRNPLVRLASLFTRPR